SQMTTVQGKRYEKIGYLGTGQFANVYKGKDLRTGQFVAIKKIKLGSRHEAKDGIHRTALREIKLLMEIHHDNIIGLRDVFEHKTSIHLIMDLMETDLENVIKDTGIIFLSQHVKNITLQTLQGLEYLHANWILHRDLKPNNLLMNAGGTVKITDFGLARFFGEPNRCYTPQVVTRWYRAPELFYGARTYGVGVDMWAMGCIVAELLLRTPLFPGDIDSDINQLLTVYKVLGTPTDEDWPLMKTLPDYFHLKEQPPIDLRHKFSAAGDEVVQLIKGCLEFDPLKRWSASDALKSSCFSTAPFACPNDQLPLPDRCQPASKKKRVGKEGESTSAARKRLDFA
ncbi:hypothetical protein PMAYCL1PPCAC_10026, partial [Pristionchus mayeri]